MLLSGATQALVADDLPPGVVLRGLGPYRLKDLQHPEPLYQLVVDGLPADFPPLASLDRLAARGRLKPLRVDDYLSRVESPRWGGPRRKRVLGTASGAGGMMEERTPVPLCSVSGGAPSPARTRLPGAP